MKRLLSAALAFLAALALAPGLTATVVPQVDPLHGLVLAPAGFVATPAPRELSLVQAELSAATLGDIAAFRSAAGPAWTFWIDRRSGAVALVEGQGLPWAAGTTTAVALETKARALMASYPNLFQVPASQLVLDAANTRRFGERGQFWNVAFRQVIGGVPVEGAQVVFRVSHGNLVQFGVNRAIPASAAVEGVAPALTAVQAKANLGQFLGGLLPNDTFLQDGVLTWVLRGTADEVGYTGPVGAGWQPSLVYRFLFTRAGSLATWLSLVDARNGQILRFVDANDYAAVLKGSALTQTNCTDPANCVPGTAAELPVTLPNAKMTFVGGSCSGAGCYTNSAGAFSYPAGAISGTATLEGRYFNFVDTCGPIAATGLAPANPDLGASDPLANLNVDCFPAHRESEPNNGPLLGGTGDTRSARTMYYHLNLINQKSRFYLPHNQWLKGVDGTDVVPTVATNVPPACNAFWAGGQNLFVFMRLTPGLNCNNSGEVPAVGLHEFGHGLDQHDGTGNAPESATGEAMGDTFALLQGQKACFGAGFRLPDATNPWANTAGYGDATTGSASRLCTGVRDLDYTKLCSRGSGPDCIAPRDPDAPNGSRSGLNPPADPGGAGEAGTPARWNHMIDTAPVGTADGLSEFYSCGGPETTGCAGPLNHGCHCESSIPSQANWDLAKALISSEFGGDVYADPPGPAEVSGWQYMDRLWYLTRDLAVSGYSVTGPYPEGTTNGCTATDWFSTYRFIDDDNGNLADGTPHADILFAAFDLHGIACGTASSPENQGAGCPAPIAAPTASTCGDSAPVQLTWTSTSGATEYRVLRNTLGCGFGFTPLASVGDRTYFEDTEVAPGVTYYYSVQPVGQSASCYGQASNCVAVTPSACSASPVPAPTQVTLSTPTANAVQISWAAAFGTGSYKILRKPGNCSSTAPEEAVGMTTEGSFTDRDRIVGGQTYSYRVVAAADSCASCASAASACQSITAAGICTAPPAFAGVKTVKTATDGSCRLDLTWDAATPACGGATISYDVYRSTDPNFTPSASNRLNGSLAPVTGTSYSDRSVVSGTRYYYVVRAVDSRGNTEGNLVRRWEIPGGTLSAGTYQDDAGDTGGGALRFHPAATAGNGWTVRTSGTGDAGNTTRHWATTASGNYPGNACQALESDTIHLGANPALTFRSRYDIEQGWDGGYVEVATESSGFTNWTKLGTVNYPGIMLGPQGEPACGGPGFADGQPVFTGKSLLDQWSSHSGSLSAYANQAVRIRFLFSSDGATEQTGWFLDDIKVTGALLPAPCRCRQIDDSDPAIEYLGFFYDDNTRASNGGYHVRTGVKDTPPPPHTRLVFDGGSLTYHYATSNRGGSADVYIDGQRRETLSYLGSTQEISFGISKTYSNLGPGQHEFKIVHLTGAVYIDGFSLGCSTP